MSDWKLKSREFFALGEAERRELERHAVERRFSKGETLWLEGDKPETFWMLRSGRVKLVMESAEGASRILRFYTPGQSFCPASILLNREYESAAVAASDVVVLAVPAARVREVFDRLPGLARDLLMQMAAETLDARSREAASSAPVKTRMALLLTRLRRQFQAQRMPLTRQDLADMSGTAVETACRTLSQWEKDGVIESLRGSLLVRKPELLEEMAV